ncbi:hypothetical protein CFR78_00480 [Komagataeibacter rhaeticus]|nr:hypothetical protein CT154_15385 [Komagataeibacter xylinus]PYD54932.1 hypothetical protein CFR78_00480 [Komagataeibacter rhaeticus]
MVKLFSKSFEERRLFEKRRHPKTFIPFCQSEMLPQVYATDASTLSSTLRAGGAGSFSTCW